MFLRSPLFSPEGDSSAAASTALSQVAATSTAADTSAASQQQSTVNPSDFFSLSLKDLSPDKLPEDLRDWGTLKKYPTAADALRAHRELEKSWNSRQQLKPPGEGSKPEEVQAWRDLLGVPKTPAEYGLTKPEKLPEGVEWNEDLAKGFAELAHKHNIPPAAVKEIIDFHNGNIGKMTEGAKAQQAQVVETAKSELQKMWGADVQKNGAMAAKIAEMGGMENPLDDPEFANNPKLIKVMHNLAEMFNKLTAEPGSLITGQNTPMGQTSEAAMDKIRASDDYLGKNGPQKQLAAVEQLKRIHDASKK